MKFGLDDYALSISAGSYFVLAMTEAPWADIARRNLVARINRIDSTIKAISVKRR